MRRIWMCLASMPGTACQAAPQTPYAFGVFNQRSPQATATCWNPVLDDGSARAVSASPYGLTGYYVPTGMFLRAAQSPGLSRVRGFVAVDRRDDSSRRSFFKHDEVPLNG